MKALDSAPHPTLLLAKTAVRVLWNINLSAW